MKDVRSVVITGASRGLGLASAIHLHREGWHVIGAMRSPDVGLERIRAATGADADDPRLTGVPLDLADPVSIEKAAGMILDLVEAPYGLVHNAGIVSVGCVEELPPDIFEDIFTTNVFGANRLTAALLPSMRAAGCGRIVVISSEGAIHGMPAISAYSASKGALERWAEAVAMEVAPFGLGVSVLVTGTFKTDILDRDHTVSYGDVAGPYGQLHAGQARLEEMFQRLAVRTGAVRAGPGKGLGRPGSVHAACRRSGREGDAGRQSTHAGRTVPADGVQAPADPAARCASGRPDPTAEHRAPRRRLRAGRLTVVAQNQTFVPLCRHE